MFTINKSVTTIQGALAQFTSVVDGIKKAQQKLAETAQNEIDVLIAKQEEQQRIQDAANLEIQDADQVAENIIAVFSKGTSLDNQEDNEDNIVEEDEATNG